MEYKLALIGFGNVGQGLAEILSTKAPLLREKFDADIRIVAICDLDKGSIADPNGFEPQALLDHIKDKGDLKEFPAANRNWDASETIAMSGADVLVELSFTDLKSARRSTLPRLGYLRPDDRPKGELSTKARMRQVRR